MEENLEVMQNLDDDIGQNSFLQSSLGQAINVAVDVGLRAILPDMIEDQVIDIKDTMINEGFSEGISQVIDNAIDFGKAAIGVITGNFESVSQAENAVKEGGIIDGVSAALDFVLKKIDDADLLPKGLVKTIKTGKNEILDGVSNNIEKEFENQTKNFENLEKYSLKWKDAFSNKDFSSMEKSMKKINSLMKKIMPIEKIINDARTMQNLHELVKNNNGDFNISDEEIELANVLK